MKYLFTILLLAVTSLTHGQDTIKIPVGVAKQIVKDLVTCDSNKAILDVTKEELVLTRTKVELKDSLLANAGSRIFNLQHQLTNQEAISNNYNKLFEDTKQQYKNLAKEYKQYKVKSRFVKVVGTIGFGALLYLYITK